MTQTKRHDTEIKRRPDSSGPLPREQDTFPPLSGPGCSCGTPAKTAKWEFVIMLIVLGLTAIACKYSASTPYSPILACSHSISMRRSPK